MDTIVRKLHPKFEVRHRWLWSARSLLYWEFGRKTGLELLTDRQLVLYSSSDNA